MPTLARRPAFALIAQAASVLGTGGGPRRHRITVVTSATALQAVLAAAFLALCPLVQAQTTSFSVYTPKSGCHEVEATLNGSSVALAVAYAF